VLLRLSSMAWVYIDRALTLLLTRMESEFYNDDATESRRFMYMYGEDIREDVRREAAAQAEIDARAMGWPNGLRSAAAKDAFVYLTFGKSGPGMGMKNMYFRQRSGERGVYFEYEGHPRQITGLEMFAVQSGGSGGGLTETACAPVFVDFVFNSLFQNAARGEAVIESGFTVPGPDVSSNASGASVLTFYSYSLDTKNVFKVRVCFQLLASGVDSVDSKWAACEAALREMCVKNPEISAVEGETWYENLIAFTRGATQYGRLVRENDKFFLYYPHDRRFKETSADSLAADIDDLCRKNELY
jgi:hypothetical protein